MKNVIILTSGLSGSSVLTGLLSRAGFWTGDKTYQKRDYDTHENKELIDLNLQLFKEAQYKGNYLLEYSSDALQNIAALPGRIDPGPYASFLKKCESHEPWIWKDPRLWLTIRYWKHFLNLEECNFVLLTRGSLQSWISSTLRRQITSYRYSRRYEEQIKQSILAFFNENRISYASVSYEGLIQRPAETIAALNGHLKTALTVEDLQKVYTKPLYKSPRTTYPKMLKAMLIYLKNYNERLDIVS